MEIDEDSARVSFPPPLIYLGMLAAGLALDFILPWQVALPTSARIAAAALLIGSGIGLSLAATGRFRRAHNDVRPWKSTTSIVDTGIYAITRNPMYLGMLHVFLGLAAALSSLGALLMALPLVIIIRTQVIAREERYLTAKFGAEYVAYKARVRRWL
ncbi:MAG: isoprenylcysteine carboxylmethyltransferase family protein [Sphingopyxis sp.]